MKTLTLSVAAVLVLIVLGTAVNVEARGGRSAGGDVSVSGYYRSNGTYVEPSHRSAPDSSRLNNWSTRGNTNPYTGQEGTKNYPDSGYRYESDSTQIMPSLGRQYRDFGGGDVGR